MRAVLCREIGRVEDLTLGESPSPEPGPGEVVIEVRAAGVNFPDLLRVQGRYQAKLETPFIPGGEAAGVVTRVGEGVRRVQEGDAVIAMEAVGAFAEEWVVPEASTVPLPPGIGFDVAAGVAITYGTSYYALRQRAQLAPGETLLVLGAAGGVGLAAVELGKLMGARVIAAASSEAKLEAAKAAGAEEGILYDREDLKARIKELTAGRGVDVVYDPVGGDYSEPAVRGMAWNGRYLVVGFAAGSIPKIPLNLTLLKGCSLVGVFWGSWLERDPAASAQNFAQLGTWLTQGDLKPRVKAYPLEDFAEGLAELSDRRAMGKIVLTPTR